MPYTRPAGMPRSDDGFDTSQAFKFLRLLDSQAPAFSFQTFAEKGDNSPNIRPQVIHAKSVTKLRQEHATGAAVFCVVNATDGTGRKSENIVRIRAVWQEDDDNYSGAFPLEPSMVVESSPGHFHRYWLVADEWPTDEKGRADFAAIMERMVETYGSDKNAKDISRVLRLPGFLHRKAQPFMVRIIETGGKRYTRAELLAAFPPVVREKKAPAPQRERKPRDDEDERIREALNHIDPDPRDIWRDIGMALKEHMGEAGRPLWDAWARRSDKFDERDQDKTWKSFHRHDIKIGTLFHYAKQGGWKVEREKNHTTGGGKAATFTAPTGKRTAILVRADSLTPESIRWAWKNRLAFGKMAMIAGDPGLGKSTILVEIVARHTRGADFPLGEGRAIPCEAVFLTAEDGLRDTLIPRLMAAEADLSKVHFLTGTRIEGSDEEDAMFDIARDVAALRDVFKNNPNIKILVIDPLTAYLGSGTKAKENTEVRRVLSPLVKLIDEFGVLLLANNHLNKNSGKALYRVLDSIAFVALGRIVHLVAEDTDNRDLKKFLCSKTNIGPMPKGLSYIIQTVWIKGEQGEEIETTRISWGTQYIDETADEALAGDTDAGTATDEAEEFLRMVLAKGRVRIQDVEAQAREARLLGDDQEISLSKPFRSARKRLKVVFSRDGFGPGAICYWSLPEDAPSTIDAPIAATSTDRATM